MKPIILSIKDLVTIADKRRNNKFDFNVVVSGSRGNGKSTLLFKFFARFGDFKPWRHQVYSRKDVIELIEAQQFGYVFDDEAINSSYKRNFYDTEQKKLIQMINMYRDQFNIYGMAVPNFYSLDKDMRDLIKMHIHVIRRGWAVVHMAKEGNLYSDDCWDIKYNKKIEERWSKKMKKDPGFTPPYHKLSTFIGYVKFGDLPKRQRQLYEEIKKTKRKKLYDEQIKEEKDTERTKYEKILERIKQGKINSQMLIEISLAMGVKYRSMRDQLNKMLTEEGDDRRLSSLLLVDKKKPVHSSNIVQFDSQIPEPTVA